MATQSIRSTLETHEWILACTEYEHCEIEALNVDVSFVESPLKPPIDPKETDSMYIIKNIPKQFSGDGSSALWVFINKKVEIRKRPLVPQKVIAGSGDISLDAYGHQKTVSDISLFSSAFTFNIDRNLWVLYENGVEVYYDVDLTRFSVVDGKLSQSSGVNIGDTSYLRSRRFPRYQPNRGQLYSSSVFLPSKNSIGIRNFGLFNSKNGAFFSLEDGVLYAIVKTTILGVTSEVFKQEINTNVISGLNLENGNIYDIQMQWRGVGSIKWFIGDPSTAMSVIVAEYKHLSLSTDLSISNPALPAAYECINTNGTEVTIEGGCVDVSTEQGVRGNRSYASFTSGEVAITIAETPIIAIRIPQNYNGRPLTRDIILAQIDGYADVDVLIRIYYFRDPSALPLAVFAPVRNGFQEASVNGAINVPDYTKMIDIFETRIPASDSKQFINPDRGASDFVLNQGDNLLVTLQGKNNSLGGITIEWAEEI